MLGWGLLLDWVHVNCSYSPGLTLCLAPYQLLSEEAPSPAPLSCTTEEQLWLFAREAEFNKDYKLASFYHQQVKEPL